MENDRTRFVPVDEAPVMFDSNAEIARASLIDGEVFKLIIAKRSFTSCSASNHVKGTYLSD